MAERIAHARDLAHIYRVLIAARLRIDWQYRTSSILYTCTQFGIMFLDFMQIAVIFHQVDRLAGWSIVEVAFLYGTSGVAFTLGDVFISEIDRAPNRIRLGTFDQLLVRPLGPMFQLCATEFEFRRAGKLAQAVVVLVYAITHLDIGWTPMKVLVFAVMLVSGFVIFSSIWIIGTAGAFWSVESYEVVNTFLSGGSFVTQYPLQIFGIWLRRLLTLVVPTAFVNYFPALYLLDKPDPFGVPVWVRFMSPAVAIAMGCLAYFTWTQAVRHYRSTGS